MKRFTLSPGTRTAVATTSILAFGVLGMVALTALRPEPPRAVASTATPIVSTVNPEPRGTSLPITGHGSVEPLRQVSLVAEVTGRVIAVAPAFEAGGTVRAGQLLVQIDTTDYANALTSAEAEVVQREFDVIMAKEESVLAEAERDRVRARTGLSGSDAESPLGNLALKEPQLELARSGLRAAEARRADAETRMARTRVTAPFSGRVLQADVDAGQVVSAGMVLGVVYATDAVEITVPLQTSDAALIPDLWTANRVEASVRVQFGDRSYTWPAYVDRTSASVDPATRSIGAIVRVPQPNRPREAGGPPLLVGAFAEVTLVGQTAAPYLAIPATALHEGDRVWLVEDGRLRQRPVEVLHRENGQVLVSGGLSEDDRVVTSGLEIAAENMTVRTAGT